MYKTVLLFLFSFLVVCAGCIKEKEEVLNEGIAKEIIYVGTFSGRGSQGLYVFELDRATGVMQQLQTISDRGGPNFQALHPNGNFLYSISGDAFSEEKKHGTVSAYRIDQETGTLTLINEQSVEGRGPAHVSVDPLEKFVYVSNYGEGNLSVFKIDDDGGLSEAVDVVQHEGSSINERRQQKAYVHSTIPSSDGRFIYASDLGTDQIMIYSVNRETGELTPAESPYVENVPGSGPRHFVIHPSGDFAYSAQELTSTVSAFSRNKSNGALNRIQRVSMLPDGFSETNSAADIHISPDGKFLYASNRGHNSLVIFEIDESNGNIKLVGHEPTQGGHPRNFMMDKKGEFILVANRDNDNVVMLRRDKETGEISYNGQETEVPMAVCVTQLFLN